MSKSELPEGVTGDFSADFRDFGDYQFLEILGWRSRQGANKFGNPGDFLGVVGGETIGSPSTGQEPD